MASRPPLSRRGLLAAVGGTAGALVLAACGEDSPAPTPSGYSEKKVGYGDENINQFGYFATPTGTPKRLVVLIHGGFWQDQYRQDLMTSLAADLVGAGYATWNIEYSRVGTGGAYPVTFTDVARAIDHTAQLPGMKGLPVTVVGHSAGGQLAVWAASRNDNTPGGSPKVVADVTVSLSGVLDLTSAADAGLGNGATVSLMGNSPAAGRVNYALADPMLLVPARNRVVAVHAKEDGIVPISQSASYVSADQAAGGTAELITVPGDHFALIDPGSQAWATVRKNLG